ARRADALISCAHQTVLTRRCSPHLAQPHALDERPRRLDPSIARVGLFDLEQVRLQPRLCEQRNPTPELEAGGGVDAGERARCGSGGGIAGALEALVMI